MASIHPQHSATSSASAVVTERNPEPFLWTFIHTSAARSWFLAIHTSNAAASTKARMFLGSGMKGAMGSCYPRWHAVEIGADGSTRRRDGQTVEHARAEHAAQAHEISPRW